ncbi:MAG: NAD-dependent epimerase/dehydratase family protein [Promethearchaeota archaeon]
MTTKVLLTGAFGNVGTSTLEELLKGDFEITIFELKNPKNRITARKLKNKAKVIWGDLRKKEDLIPAIIGKDVVIHVGAIIPPLADLRPKLAEAVNVGGTQNIISIIKEKSPNTKLIFTSSISVYGDRVRNPFIKTSDPLKPSKGDEYAVTKIKAEKMIKESGIDYVIFRLTYIVEPYRVQFNPTMFKMPLETSLEVCHSKDVGLALTNAAASNNIWGGTYHIAGGEKCRITYKEYLDDMTEIFGLGRELLPAEAFSEDGYHCGYLDTNDGEDKLHYQRYSLRDIYKTMKKRFRGLKLVTWMFRPLVRHLLLKKSDIWAKNKELKTK